MRVLLPRKFLKGIIAFLLFLIGTAALLGATLPASFQQQLGLSATGSIFANLFHTRTVSPFAVTATVTTDKQDYPIGATVIIGGSGWTPGETVTLQVTDNLSATDPNYEAHAPWDVVADSNGNISSTWVVDEDADGLTLTLTAVGHSSGQQAQTTFTDANPSATLAQCANDKAPSPSNDGCDVSAADWVSGNVNGAKANYFEGDYLPYRMILQNLDTSSGNTHKLTIEWDTTKGSKHALDYIGTFNQTVADANPCLGIPVANGDPACGPASIFLIPKDPQVSAAGVTQPDGNLTIYGGTITDVIVPTSVGSTVCDATNTSGKYCYSTGTGFTGDKSAAITIVFTATQSNPVIAWSGHISTRKDWGFQNSAIAVSGSPYHTRLIALDGSGGNQDRSLSADAVFFPVQLTIIKQTDPDDAPVKQFDYKTTGTDLQDFSLTPPNGTTPVQTSFTLTDGSTRTVTESDPHLTLPKFTLTDLSCSEVDGGLGTGGFTITGPEVSFAPKEGQTITCTYTNTEDKKANDGKIIVDKVTDPTGDPTLFTFTSDFSGTFKLADQSTPLDSGLILPGTYSVSEGAVADWTLTSKTCTSDSGFSAQDPSSITLHAGETITCTFKNTKLTAGISVTKTPSVTDICDGTSTSVTYTYKVTNTGTADLTVDLSDDVLGSIASGVSLAAGASKTFTKSTSISATTKNTVTANGTTAGGQKATASASATVTAHTCTISITKEPSTTDVCNGSTVSYTIKVTNNSDKFSWTGSVVDDILGSLSASTTLAPGGSKTFTPSGSITGTVKNTATADGKFDDPATASAKASASATVTGHVCTISITKEPSVTDVCNGSTVSYTIKVTNNSDKFSWTGSVVDDILGSLSASTTLAPGGSSTFTPSGSVTGTVKNTATADGKFDDGSATSAKASASATVTGHICTISITKEPSTTDVCDGSTVSYTIKITNNSDKFSWTGSVVDDILGTLSASTTLAAGGSATFTPSGTISGTVKNTVTGDGKFDDGSATSAKASASATVTGHTCTISITKTPSTTDVCNGSTVSYTIKVTNNSDKFNWTGKLDDDVLGSLSASFSLAPGGSQTFTPSGSITGTVKNTATADGKFDDGSGTTAKASASATVTGHVCSISVTKTPSTTDVCNGASASYTIKVTNNSDKYNWTGSVVDDILGTLASTLTLGPGGSATYTPSGTISGTVKNTATANGKFDDGSGTTAKASASATVNGHICRITVKKKTVPAGDPAKFTFGGDLPGSIGDGGSLTVDVLSPGAYTTGETIPTGWDLTDISCSTGGSTSTVTPVAAGGSNSVSYNVVLDSNISCTFTNTKRGTIIIKKITDPPNTGTFTFTTTTDSSAYNGFNLNGGQSNTQGNLLPGTYTAKEGMQLGWILTGVGFNPPLADPKACQVVGNGGSTGTGDIGTQTATIILKPGDTVTCVFENSGTGVTRTQGFWATHPELANVAWFGGSFGGLSKLPGVPDQMFSPCGRSITTLAQLMGGFWSGVSKTSTGGKRSPLDQARMQLLQQLLAAELNYSAFGTVPAGGVGMFAQWEAAYCGTNVKAISDAQGQAASYNSQGDSSQFTPGTSANSQGAKAIAAYSYWDKLP